MPEKKNRAKIRAGLAAAALATYYFLEHPEEFKRLSRELKRLWNRKN